jgi:predicted secreted protein
MYFVSQVFVVFAVNWRPLFVALPMYARIETGFLFIRSPEMF